MMRRWLLCTLLLPLFCAGFGVGARAQTQTGTGSCTADYSDIIFANNGKGVDILSTQPIDGVGQITVKCSNLATGFKARVCLGMNPALINDPKMVNQSDLKSVLIYDIFTNEARTDPWYSQQKKRPYVDVDPAKATPPVSVYGRIRARQSASPIGQYIDNVTPPFRYFIYKYQGPSSVPDCDSPGYNRTTMGVKVTALITPNCKFTSKPNDMEFKDPSGVTGIIAKELTAQTELNLSCTTNAPYSVGLGPGDHNPSRGAETRYMCKTEVKVGSVDEAKCIKYGLYTDNGLPWGLTDPLGSGADSKPRKASSSGEKITVNGKMPKPDKSPAPGFYSDQITVTVNF